MESPQISLADILASEKDAPNESVLFSSQSVLDILRMILAGAPLSEVLTIIARLVESRDDGTLCTIWLPDDDGKQLYCAAAPRVRQNLQRSTLATPSFACAVYFWQ